MSRRAHLPPTTNRFPALPGVGDHPAQHLERGHVLRVADAVVNHRTKFGHHAGRPPRRNSTPMDGRSSATAGSAATASTTRPGRGPHAQPCPRHMKRPGATPPWPPTLNLLRHPLAADSGAQHRYGRRGSRTCLAFLPGRGPSGLRHWPVEAAAPRGLRCAPPAILRVPLRLGRRLPLHPRRQHPGVRAPAQSGAGTGPDHPIIEGRRGRRAASYATAAKMPAFLTLPVTLMLQPPMPAPDLPSSRCVSSCGRAPGEWAAVY